MKPLKQICQNGQTEGTEIFYMSCMERLLLSLQIDSDWTDTARAMGDSMLDDNMETANVYQKALKNYQQYMDKLEKKHRRISEQRNKNKSSNCEKRLEKNV